MYRLTYEDYILYDPRLATPEDRLIIRDPKVHLAVDKAGEMSFLLQPEHPYVDKLRKMSGVVELTDGATPIYRGRITRDTIDFYGVHTVETEGLLACLNDSIIEPFTYPEDFTEDAGYQEAAAAGNVVEYLFRWLLAQHNAQVSTEQQLKPGTCTVTDPNNYITRSSTDYQTTMEAIRSKLFGSSLGGHLLIRYETDGNYLDYYADLPLTNTQPVEFAANLLDLTAELDGTDIYTAILPLGKDGLTIAELSDTDLTDDLVKSGKIIYSKSGIAAHGRITRCIKWDDVTVPANLQTKAKAALADNGLAMPETITVRAVDLGWQDAVQHFRVGRMTLLASTPHGYRASYPLLELSPDILDPGNTQITMGATRATYTGTQIEEDWRRDEETNRREENIKEDTRQQLDQVIRSTSQQITDLQRNVDSIILSALERYVETGDFESYKEEVSTKLSVLTDQLSIDITRITERIDDVDGDLQSKYSEITKAFRFTSDGLIIGESGNEILLRLDNDVLQFVRNNTPELQITAEGVEAMRIKVSILCIGNVVWMEDENGDVIAA
ncbi:MAG: phage tail protein [Oscillospiraceae bacterium]